jgi:4-carboxymuconolactone decarboxylase
MTERSRYETGTSILQAHLREPWTAVQERLADVAPDLARFIAEWAFGDIYSREGLDLKRRELLTLACLTTLGGSEEEIRIHTSGALSNGLAPNEITEAVLHCLPYVGFPRVLTAMSAVRDTLERESRLPVK